MAKADSSSTSAGHTAGPWSVSVVSHTEVIGPGQRTICRAHRDAPTRSEDETRANARLIAAAPELLEALAPFSRMFWVGELPDDHEFDGGYTVGDLRRVRAAIARARGEQA